MIDVGEIMRDGRKEAKYTPTVLQCYRGPNESDFGTRLLRGRNRSSFCRIIVLSNGEIVEQGSPTGLLESKNSVFYSMAKDAGIV